MLIGLTGSIGSGKTTVADRLRALGAQVLDADAFARMETQPGSQGLCAIAAAFGDGILKQDGSLERTKLAELVFQDEEKLRALNAILHPRILEAMRRRAAEIFEKDPEATVVYDMPLLIEVGEHLRVDRVWLVTADDETRIARIVARDGCTREAALSRIRAQMPQAEKRAYAHEEIDNSQGLEALYARVDALYGAVKELHERQV